MRTLRRVAEHADTLRQPTLVQTPPQGAGEEYTSLSNVCSTNIASVLLAIRHRGKEVVGLR